MSFMHVTTNGYAWKRELLIGGAWLDILGSSFLYIPVGLKYAVSSYKTSRLAQDL